MRTAAFEGRHLDFFIFVLTFCYGFFSGLCWESEIQTAVICQLRQHVLQHEAASEAFWLQTDSMCNCGALTEACFLLTCNHTPHPAVKDLCYLQSLARVIQSGAISAESVLHGFAFKRLKINQFDIFFLSCTGLDWGRKRNSQCSSTQHDVRNPIGWGNAEREEREREREDKRDVQIIMIINEVSETEPISELLRAHRK